MKKLLVFTTALFGFYFSNAQTTSFGVKAGLNLASMESSSQDLGAKPGLYIGGLAHIHVTSKFAVQPEIYYSMQGGKEDNVTNRVNYVNIPVLAQYMAGGGFRLQTGPQLGIFTGGEREEGNSEFDLNDFVKTTDFSWVFGGGYLFPSGFGVDIRYNLGLSDIAEDGTENVKNRVFQLGVFYQFGANGNTSAKRK